MLHYPMLRSSKLYDQSPKCPQIYFNLENNCKKPYVQKTFRRYEDQTPQNCLSHWTEWNPWKCQDL